MTIAIISTAHHRMATGLDYNNAKHQLSEPSAAAGDSGSIRPSRNRLRRLVSSGMRLRARQGLVASTDSDAFARRALRRRPSTTRTRSPSLRCSSLPLPRMQLRGLRYQHFDPASRFRLATLGMLAVLRLTEVEVHGFDLDIGCTPWSEVFVDVALPTRIRRLATRPFKLQTVRSRVARNGGFSDFTMADRSRSR